jgi:bifunctional enzyme CysN/CysC
VDTLHRDEVETLGLNDIGRVEITTAEPIFFDRTSINHATGSFILVDPFTNVTVAAGMIRGEVRPPRTCSASPSAPIRRRPTWSGRSGTSRARSARRARPPRRRALVHRACRARARARSPAPRARLFELGCRTMLLDGDQLRHGLCGDLGFSPEDRTENIRRAGEVARLFFEQGSIVLCTFVSPYRADRDHARAIIPTAASSRSTSTATSRSCAGATPRGSTPAQADEQHAPRLRRRDNRPRPAVPVSVQQPVRQVPDAARQSPHSLHRRPSVCRGVLHQSNSHIP